MKKNLLLLCAVLLVLGCCLPPAGYYIAGSLLSSPAGTAPSSSPGSEPEPGGLDGLTLEGETDPLPAEEVLLWDEAAGSTFTLSVREYLIGAVASEMPVSWPDEALKAQAVASHSYLLYCRDHRSTEENGGAWLSVDPARRQGCLTDPVLRSYWGTAYEQNYARLSALVDQVADALLLYDGAPAAACYHAISCGRTEASEEVWESALPYLRSVESPWDRSAEGYEVTVELTEAQVSAALAEGLGLQTGDTPPDSWFSSPSLTDAGYVSSLTVCGQPVGGTTLRQVLGLRSSCFFIQYQGGSFAVTTQGYGHGVGLSQWGAKGMAEEGQSYQQILAHYFPGSTLQE